MTGQWRADRSLRSESVSSHGPVVPASAGIASGPVSADAMPRDVPSALARPGSRLVQVRPHLAAKEPAEHRKAEGGHEHRFDDQLTEKQERDERDGQAARPRARPRAACFR